MDRLTTRSFPSKTTFKVVGFTTEMDEYMTASDILVGKPGGLTTSEALSKGLVFVIVNPIPGQEERNSDHLLEEGVGIRCNNLPTLAYKIDRLLDDPHRFASMQNNARKMARPAAAYNIVKKLLTLQKNLSPPLLSPGLKKRSRSKLIQANSSRRLESPPCKIVCNG